jgi:hypothetical protein
MHKTILMLNKNIVSEISQGCDMFVDSPCAITIKLWKEFYILWM